METKLEKEHAIALADAYDLWMVEDETGDEAVLLAENNPTLYQACRIVLDIAGALPPGETKP